MRMKNLYTAGLLVVCSLFACTTSAQPTIAVKQQIPDKPLQFSSLPDKFECSLPILEKAVSSRATEKVSLRFGKFTFTGDVMERVQQSKEVVSINIRSTNFPGALFNISVQTQPDNTRIINGCIINPQSGDVLILTQENNRYYLQKQQQKFFMTE